MKSTHRLVIAGAIVVLLLATACAGAPAPAPVTTQPAASAKTASAPAATQPAAAAQTSAAATAAAAVPDWDKVVDAAKKEGTVTVYESVVSPDGQKALAEAMSKKYGIRVELATMTGAAAVAKARAEQNSRAYVADVVTGGTPNFMASLEEGFYEPIIVPSLADANAWKVHPYYMDDQKKRLLTFLFPMWSAVMFNTQMAKPEDVDSYQKLLDPKWKGKIVMDDPRVTGGGITVFRGLYAELGENFVRQLAPQLVVRTGAIMELPKMVARGEYPIGLAGQTGVAIEVIAQGSPLGLGKPKEGIATAPGGVVKMANAPHPNAARLYLDFFFSQEGQNIIVKQNATVSMRKDTSTPDHPALKAFPADYKYWTFTKEISDLTPKMLDLAKELFK